MKIRYDAEADVLFLVLRENPPVDAIEEPGGVIVSYGEDGEPVSVGISQCICEKTGSTGRSQCYHTDGESECMNRECLIHQEAVILLPSGFRL